MANTLSKEEIREKHLRLNGLSVNKSAIGKSIQKAAFDAMDEFAKQQAIAFAEWCDANYYNEDGSNNELVQFEVKYQTFLNQSKQQ